MKCQPIFFMLNNLKNLKYLPLLLLFSCENKAEVKTANTLTGEGYPTVETVIADLDNDQILDTIRLSEEPEYDPGEFRELTIEFSKLGHFQTNANEVWDSISPQFAKRYTNAVKSSRIFVAKKPEGTFILLFGYPYPSERCELSVVSIVDGKVQMQQISKFKEAEEFTNFDGDGTTELIGRNNYEVSEVNDDLDADLGTYAPFYVLSYVKNGKSGAFQLDSKLTEEYNQKNYVWKGMNYDENIKVWYPRNGEKPRLAN